MSQIGCGRSSTVYLAEHLKSKQHQVIKCIPKAQNLKTSYLKEVHLLKNLRHPSIPVIYDVEEDDRYYYIMEEYVWGQSLSAFVQSQDNISQETIISIGLEICDVINYLHHAKPFSVLYLDLKPEHIILCDKQLKLIDFGNASFVGESTDREPGYGTKGFAAPEQYENQKMSPQTDIYGIGAILYYMLTGECLSQVYESSVSFPENCSNIFKEIILKSTAENPGDRFASVDELACQLKKNIKNRYQGNIRDHLLGNSDVEVLHRGKEANQIQLGNLKPKPAKIVIGVMGVAHGLGTTHLSIALANYTANYLKASTAWIEFGERNHFTGESLESREPFWEKRVAYYPALTSYDIAMVCGMDYQYIILDLGPECRDARQELLRCDRRLIVGSVKPWRREEYKKLIKNILELEGNKEAYTFLGLFSDKMEKKFLKRTFNLRLYDIAYIENPYCIQEKDIPFLHSLI